MSTVNRIRAALDSRAMTRAVQLIAVLSLMLSLGVGAKQYSLADCLARYNDESAKAAAPRFQAAEDDRRAQDQLFDDIASPTNTRAEKAAAFQAYIESRRKTNATRAKNPPPPPPSEVCH